MRSLGLGVTVGTDRVWVTGLFEVHRISHLSKGIFKDYTAHTRRDQRTSNLVKSSCSIRPGARLSWWTWVATDIPYPINAPFNTTSIVRKTGKLSGKFRRAAL